MDDGGCPTLRPHENNVNEFRRRWHGLHRFEVVDRHDEGGGVGGVGGGTRTLRSLGKNGSGNGRGSISENELRRERRNGRLS